MDWKGLILILHLKMVMDAEFELVFFLSDFDFFSMAHYMLMFFSFNFLRIFKYLNLFIFLEWQYEGIGWQIQICVTKLFSTIKKKNQIQESKELYAIVCISTMLFQFVINIYLLSSLPSLEFSLSYSSILNY